VEVVHRCEDLECIVEKFLSMERALLRASEYAILVNLYGGRAFCTYVSLARRDAIEEYEPSVGLVTEVVHASLKLLSDVMIHEALDSYCTCLRRAGVICASQV
jgi:hypothetical protein